jgi:hypothetical protein
MPIDLHLDEEPTFYQDTQEPPLPPSKPFVPGKTPGTGVVEEYTSGPGGEELLERRRVFTDIGPQVAETPQQKQQTRLQVEPWQLPPQITQWHLDQVMSRDDIGEEEAVSQIWDEYDQTGKIELYKPKNVVPGLPGITYGLLHDMEIQTGIVAETLVRKLKKVLVEGE